VAKKLLEKEVLTFIGRLDVREGKKWLRFMDPNFKEKLGEKVERAERAV
jgi:hypothetical protein